MESKGLINFLLAGFLLISLSYYEAIKAQDLRKTSVFNISGSELLYPWAGGMNSMQFGEVDMNMDGEKDLLAFDRTGNRLMPFINHGDAYQYAPEYVERFPQISDWIILADYNKDGKEDIFTYSPGYASMKVFKNTSSQNLEFTTEVFPYLTSFQGGGYVNILVTYADYPAITDIDNDGDLDILTFWGLGSFVERHVNLSFEKYGHYDSLDYEKVEYCWGYFAESEESNEIWLDTCFLKSGNYNPYPDSLPRLGEGRGGGDRHTGSTFTLIDRNGNDVKDLILGDVDYPGLIELTNGGTAEDAYMSSYSHGFPAESNKVDLFAMPLGIYIDVTFDGIRDLLVSPFDPNPFVVENKYSVSLYKNSGSNELPVFILESEEFLQSEILDFGSGSYPVVIDYDGDGLEDIIAGNYGYYVSSYYDPNLILYSLYNSSLALLRNIGTPTQPAFRLDDKDLFGLAALGYNGLVPTFADLDGDLDLDLIVGSENGQLLFYRNNAGAGSPIVLDLEDPFFQSIDVGDFSAPALLDLTGDGLPDLVVGEKKGNLNFYTNTGTLQDPIFTFVTDSLGHVNVTDPNISLDGFSCPAFFKVDENRIDLVIGSEKGKIFYYPSIQDELQGTFKESDTLFHYISGQEQEADRGYRTAAVVHDIDHDGYLELIAGNFSGGLEYFTRVNTPPAWLTVGDPKQPDPDIIVSPNPASSVLLVKFEEGYELASAVFNLYNSSGQLIISQKIQTSGVNSINIYDLEPGFYYYQVIFASKLKISGPHNGKILIL